MLISYLTHTDIVQVQQQASQTNQCFFPQARPLKRWLATENIQQTNALSAQLSTPLPTLRKNQPEHRPTDTLRKVYTHAEQAHPASPALQLLHAHAAVHSTAHYTHSTSQHGSTSPRPTLHALRTCTLEAGTKVPATTLHARPLPDTLQQVVGIAGSRR